MRLFLLSSLILSLTFTAGCDWAGSLDRKPSQFEDRLEVRSDELTVRLEAPDSVESGDSFSVRVLFSNESSEDITLQTGNGCLTSQSVRDTGGDDLHWAGSPDVCMSVVTDHKMPAGEVVEYAYDDYEAAFWTRDGIIPAPSGTYWLRVRTGGTIDGEVVRIPDLQKEITVYD